MLSENLDLDMDDRLFEETEANAQSRINRDTRRRIEYLLEQKALQKMLEDEYNFDL